MLVDPPELPWASPPPGCHNPPPTMTVAVVAEKPSVARDLAAALGARTSGRGCFRGGGYVVTWTLGHLVGIAEPHQMNPRWKRWNLDDLPLVPDAWPLVVLDE